MSEVKKEVERSKAEDKPSSEEDGACEATLDGDDSEDPVVTLDEVIAEEKELLENAREVLAGSDDKNCSYPEGYVKRQALYACLTCTGGRARAGVCLACTYACHQDHELVELYTKRNFRCDCGNSLFADAEGKTRPCALVPDKDPVNEKNSYNHNFDGVYCICSKPYPCDEYQDVEMVQCCVCEDWFHATHLGPVVPPEDSSSYDSLTCPTCLATHPILIRYYESLSVKKLGDEEACEKADVEVKAQEVHSPSGTPVEVTSGCEGAAAKGSQKRAMEETEESDKSAKRLKSESQETGENHVAITESVEAVASCSASSDTPSGVSSTECRLPAESPLMSRALCEKVTAFWKKDWRDALCRCEACLKRFQDENLEFLLDPEDTLDAYANKGDEKPCISAEITSSSDVLSMLRRSGMNHVSLVEVAFAYSEMSSKFAEFLRPFAASGKVVSREDVTEFFAKLKQDSSSRLVQVPYSCR